MSGWKNLKEDLEELFGGLEAQEDNLTAAESDILAKDRAKAVEYNRAYRQRMSPDQKQAMHVNRHAARVLRVARMSESEREEYTERRRLAQKKYRMSDKGAISDKAYREKIRLVKAAESAARREAKRQAAKEKRKAYNQARRQTPEYKAMATKWQQTYRAKKKLTAEEKMAKSAAQKAYAQTPEGKAALRAGRKAYKERQKALKVNTKPCP